MHQKSTLQCAFVVHFCGGLMSHLPLVFLCFTNALWCSPHDLLLCMTFAFFSCLEFQHLNTTVFSPCKTSSHYVLLLFIFIMLFIVMILCSWSFCKVLVLFILVQIIIFYNVELDVCMVDFVSGVGEYIYTTRTCNVQGTCHMLKMCVYYQLILPRGYSTCNYTSSNYIVETTLI
jgi:hypothetical protein